VFNRQNLLDYAERVKDHAENVYKNQEMGSVDPVIGLWCDGVPQIWLFPHGVSDDVGYDCAKICWTMARNTGVDAITLVTDAMYTTSQTKVDGTPWERGEMQKAKDEGNENAHLVVDSMVITAMDRTQTAMGWFGNYRVEDDRSITWLDEEVRVEGEHGMSGQLDGRIAAAMRDGFHDLDPWADLVSMIDQKEELADLEGLTRVTMGSDPSAPPVEVLREFLAYAREHPAEAFAMQVCNMMDFFAENNCAVLIAVRDEKVQEIYDHYLHSHMPESMTAQIIDPKEFTDGDE
jgi:hypothetical protein